MLEALVIRSYYKVEISSFPFYLDIGREDYSISKYS